MGIKGSTGWFTTECLIKLTLAEARQKIRHHYNLGDDDRVVVAVDASVWVRAALSNPRSDSVVLSQYHAIPAIPVTAVADYFMKRINHLRSYKYDVVLVFDGQSNPLKREEHLIRQSNREDKQSLIKQLNEMYADPESHSVEEVNSIQKRLMSPRKDILYEVIRTAKKNNIKYVGAPFETDTQIVALVNQGIVHAAISTDSDFTAMGVPFVISDMTMSGGKVEIRSYQKLTEKVLPSVFDVKDPVDHTDLTFLVHMLGTDNIPKGLEGSGKEDVIKRMKEYLAKGNQKEKEQYITDYIYNHDTPNQCQHSMNYWRHGPAYKIKPIKEDVNLISAFFDDEYTVVLCSMSLDEYESVNLHKMGFVPNDILRDGHSPQQHQPTHDEFFRCISWSRDGLPFEPLPDQYNNSNKDYTVLHCAVIDFDNIPLKFVPTRNLRNWLCCRGVPIPSLQLRKDVEEMVALCEKNLVDPLPDFVMRIGNGCVTHSVMEFENEADATWYRGDDALHEIRSNKCPLLEKENVLESFFIDQHTAKRNRCLSHLFDGSYDLNELKVTSNLKSKLLDGELFVISFICAPSQKGLGTEEKSYNVRLVFGMKDEVVTVMPFPHSICSCAVGICKCAHKLGMLLLIHAIRGQWRSLNFEQLLERMPPNIHAVAKQCHLVTYLYPPLDSTAYTEDMEIAATAREADDGDDNVSEGEKEDDDEVIVTSTASDSVEDGADVGNDVSNTGDDGIALENLNDQQNTMSSEEYGFKKPAPINLKKELSQWCMRTDARLSKTGVSHKVSIDTSQQACEDAAKLQYDDDYITRRNIRMKRIKRSVDNNKMPKTMISWYAEHYVTTQLGGDNNDIDSNFMTYPEPYK